MRHVKWDVKPVAKTFRACLSRIFKRTHSSSNADPDAEAVTEPEPEPDAKTDGKPDKVPQPGFPFVGSTLFAAAPPLQIVEFVQGGAWSHVYKARIVPGASVGPGVYAIKVIKFEKLGKETRELCPEVTIHKTLCQEAHPNILRILSHFDDPIFDPTHSYLKFRWYEKGTLTDSIIDGNYRGNDSKVQSDFLQLLSAVQFCHKRGVSHRDLKPDNVLLADDGTLLLMDFGQATLSKSSRWSIGTGPFRSPDVAWNCVSGRTDEDAHEYSCKANDIWSLGMILVCMTTQEFCWQGAVAMEGYGNYHAYLLEKHAFLHRKFPWLTDQFINLIVGGVLVPEEGLRRDIDGFIRDIERCNVYFKKGAGISHRCNKSK